MAEFLSSSESKEIQELLAICRQGSKEEVSSCLERIRFKRNLLPIEASVLCETISSHGYYALAQDIIKYCDLETSSHSELTRIRKNIDLDHVNLADIRIWLGGTVSLHPLIPAIEVGLIHHGFKPLVACGGFDTLHHDLLNNDSDLFKYNPDFVVLAYDVSHLVSEVVAPRRNLQKAIEYIDQGIERLQGMLTSFREKSSADILIHTLPKGDFVEPLYSDGISTGNNIHTYLNQKIAGLCQCLDGVHVIDLSRLAEEIGYRNFRDERRRFFASYPASANAMASWGILISDCIRTVKKGPRKVIVLDLDDTLWGCIVGEVGPLGVEIGPQYPGNSYLEFQRNLIDLKAQGILLAVCSKNEEETALAVFKSHPYIAIKLDDIVSYQIGWEPKPDGLRKIAKELNLGLNSFVFLDDSPQERASVRQILPEVLVPDLPRDPVERPAFLKSLRELWPLSITESDINRTQLYKADKKRKSLKAEYEDYGKYLINLKQVLQVGQIADHEWKRVAQMHLRTNQFNMTTRRYSETDLHNICSEGNRIYIGSLEDCFGDQGIVVAAVVVFEKDVWKIDSFLMSCRVMKRDIDIAFLKYIINEAVECNVHTLMGEYIPTERNKPAADFYKTFGFDGPSIKEGSDSQWWKLDIDSALPETSSVRIMERDKI